MSCVLDQAVLSGDCQLSLVITDDETVKRLNSDYRGVNEVTDVLSFSSCYQGHWEGEEEPPLQAASSVPFVLPPEEPEHLGEVIISYPQAARQAGHGAVELKKELALLIVHGVLHLLGFDHVEPQDEASMRAREREILSNVC